MMKKSQRANFAVMEICNIRTFDYDVQDIYTLGSPSSKKIKLLKNLICNRVLTPYNPFDLVESLSLHNDSFLCFHLNYLMFMLLYSFLTN